MWRRAGLGLGGAIAAGGLGGRPGPAGLAATALVDVFLEVLEAVVGEAPVVAAAVAHVEWQPGRAEGVRLAAMVPV